MPAHRVFTQTGFIRVCLHTHINHTRTQASAAHVHHAAATNPLMRLVGAADRANFTISSVASLSPRVSSSVAEAAGGFAPTYTHGTSNGVTHSDETHIAQSAKTSFSAEMPTPNTSQNTLQIRLRACAQCARAKQKCNGKRSSCEFSAAMQLELGERGIETFGSIEASVHPQSSFGNNQKQGHFKVLLEKEVLSDATYHLELDASTAAAYQVGSPSIGVCIS